MISVVMMNTCSCMSVTPRSAVVDGTAAVLSSGTQSMLGTSCAPNVKPVRKSRPIRGCVTFGAGRAAPPTPPARHRQQRQQLHAPVVADVPVDGAPRVAAQRRAGEDQTARGRRRRSPGSTATGRARSAYRTPSAAPTTTAPDHARRSTKPIATTAIPTATGPGCHGSAGSRRPVAACGRPEGQQGEQRQQGESAEQTDAVRRVRRERQRDRSRAYPRAPPSPAASRSP